ncbi:MAG: hypothetical protein K6T30_04075 [Alicyclobacillus sp.]|nr:hypothetical protein [Alicyclobacillus sp.]
MTDPCRRRSVRFTRGGLAAALVVPITLGLAGCGAHQTPGPSAGGTSPNAVHTTAPGSGSGSDQSGNSAAPAGAGPGADGTAVNAPGERNGAPSSGTTSETPATRSSGGALSLEPFAEAAGHSVRVDVPSGWTVSSEQGGDFIKWTLTDPADSHRQIVVVYSSCVGCYMGPDGKPNPARVVPESGASDVETSEDGLSAGFRFTRAGNPYPGLGRVVISDNEAGYAYAETLLPADLQDEAQQILNSLSLAAS